MEISKEMAQIIFDLLECDNKERCAGCSMEGVDCDERLSIAKSMLLDVMNGVEQKNDVSQETKACSEMEAAYQLEPERVTQHISITVAEYHFLTRMATLLETILAAEQYNPKPTVDAVRTVVQEMVQQAEAGAAE